MKKKEVLVFESCFSCYSLKAGARIIGFGAITACIAGIMADIIIMVQLLNRNENFNSDSADHDLFTNCAFQIMCLVIAIVLHVLLLYGVHKKRANILNHYIAGTAVWLLLWIVGSIVFTCLEPTEDKAFALIPIPLVIIFMIMVRSLRKEMLKDSNYIQNKYSVTRPPTVSK